MECYRNFIINLNYLTIVEQREAISEMEEIKSNIERGQSRDERNGKN